MKMPPSSQNKDKLLHYYLMDMASLYPVLALDLKRDDTVLDMCAAPGGKAFVILQVVRSEAGGAVALNDCSVSRVQRLHDVVQKCVTKGLKHSVRITRRRGENWGQIEESVYDKVLVDAPCSADRHNIKKWVAQNRCWPDAGKFAKLQQYLLLSAFHAVKSGGVVVYSTCTMSTPENDAVIESALDQVGKDGYKVNVVTPLDTELEQTLFGRVEETQFGKLVVPSTTLNIGPMYLTKFSVSNK